MIAQKVERAVKVLHICCVHKVQNIGRHNLERKIFNATQATWQKALKAYFYSETVKENVVSLTCSSVNVLLAFYRV